MLETHFLVVHMFYSCAVERASATEFKYTRTCAKEQHSRNKNVFIDITLKDVDMRMSKSRRHSVHVHKMMAYNNMYNPILVTHVIVASVLPAFPCFCDFLALLPCTLQHFDETTTTQHNKQLVYVQWHIQGSAYC